MEQQTKKIDKKTKRKEYFLNAAIKILKAEGLKGFSARKVAEECGYNAASIYNYFENLDHLENLASIHFTNAYDKELIKATENMEDPFTAYISMWEIFSSYALQQPFYFYNVFFATISQTANINLFKEYYAIFPEQRPKGGVVSGMLEIDKTHDREAYMLQQCVKSGAIKAEFADYINDIHLGYFKFILTDIVKNNLYQPSPKLYHKHMQDFLHSMIHFVSEKNQKVIKDVFDFHSAPENQDKYNKFF